VEQLSDVSAVKPETIQEIKYTPPPLPVMPAPAMTVAPMPMPIPVSVPPIPPPIKVSDLQIMPDKVVEGGNLGIIITVANIVPGTVQYKLDLKINGAIHESRDFNLMPGEVQEMTFVVMAEIPGNYKVEIGGLSGSYDVLSA
jgi:hypothetical protein